MAALLAAVTPQMALAQEACPTLRWTTLGIAGGPVPTEDRAEPSNLLEAGELDVLVDVGDGTVNQLARIGRDMGSVRHIFISHLHWDHTGGLAAALGLRWMNEFPGEVTVYGPQGTAEVVAGIVTALGPPARIGFGTGVLPPPPASRIRVVELADGQSLTIDGLTVRAARNNHFDQSLEEAGTEAMSFRFEYAGRSITYTGDTGPDARVTALARGSDMLVSEVIALEPLIASILARRPDMPAPQMAAMRQHLSTHHVDAAVVGQMAAEAGVGHLVLTHFAVPGPLAASEAYLRDGVRGAYAGPVDLARDLASFDIGCADRGGGH
jgi:ribonuclease BN (tRNA processing enzyme)